MNPSVKSDCSGLSIGTYYCASTYEGGYPPGFPGWASSSSSPVSSIPLTSSTPTNIGVSTSSPIQTGMVSTCDKFYKVIADDGCYDIANDHGIPLASFYAWNPAVKPIALMVATCDEFYKAIADDSCVDIASANGIPVASFYNWSLAVKTDCSGLQANKNVCVGVSSS